jgi:uncharacterized protein VirK/YbjX
LWDKARQVHPEPTLAATLSRVKYCVRGLAAPRLTAEWFAFLSLPGLQALAEQYPYIFSKLQRPYLHRRLHARQRLAQLKTHYEFITRNLGTGFLREIITPPGFRLAPLSALYPERFSLLLFYTPHSKEGELSLALQDEATGGLLFTLTFSVIGVESAKPLEFFIGGLQGCKALNQREVVTRLTRSLHGLRPKALLVFALQELARNWNIAKIRAVGSREHIYRLYRKRKTLYSNYDEFWLECQGTRLADGNFEIPVSPKARDVGQLPRNKRPVYRRRYEMLGFLAEAIADRLRSVQRSTG